ncbi:MAG: histidine phosphatase family protein [Vulcanimicrobiaceae bacterium]
MIELVCVRHGRTAWNADLRFQGQTDVPLDAHGSGQALLLAGRLRGTTFDAAVSSDLARCVETARIILSFHPQTTLRIDTDLREMAFGDWEGLTWAQIVERDPKLALDGWSRPKTQAPPGGELFDDVVRRAARAVAAIQAVLPRGGRVLVVTHAGVLHALLRVILGDDEGGKIEIRFTPAGLSRFAIGADGVGSILGLNEVAEAGSLER